MRTVYLDRDGTLTASFGNRPANNRAEVKLLPGVLEGVGMLQDAGLRLVVVTNQAGISLGFLTSEEFCAMSDRLDQLLVSGGTSRGIDRHCFCPHGIDAGCQCRKPKPGMILEDAAMFGVDLLQSYIIGDDQKDMLAGLTAGVGTRLLVDSDIFVDPAQTLAYATHHPKNFQRAVNKILDIEKTRSK